ncbi:MAG: 16S rRNA (guanine(966)-N(2))-methyltransferase RsmD [Flavobacteriales bacterium]|mgnify:CR=1 FL=1|nr:16S rRNA (guanine(966)-N(2))-methyltransferase RsmD [Flavobacteriales bacterium]|tara:strand:- start:6469 stop:7038 length:570 start_codon:yes stop_codon:yes gene_type:complete
MRIVSGSHKSKRITAPKKLPVRPTTDMAKESLFNILNNDYFFDEICVLDLFSGTGNISYEFASRGTLEILSVDQNYNCVKFIQETAQNLNLKAIHVIQSEVLFFLQKQKISRDIIFADPPYDFKLFDDLISLVFEKKLLNKDGIFILEHCQENNFSTHAFFKKTKRYGNVNFSFFNYDSIVEEFTHNQS